MDISLADLMQISLSLRLQEQGVLVDGEPFDARTVPYLLELYDDAHPWVVIRKGAQLGLTSWAILTVLERMISGLYRRGVLYGFPTQDEVYDFSRSRFNRLLTSNQHVYANVVRDTDSVELKRIGDAFLYFRGVKVSDSNKRPSKLLSIPIDCLVLDEHDDMDLTAVDIAQQRLDSSELRHRIELGHPSLPNLGIDAKYNASDQRRYMLRCDACGQYTCLEDEFPHCIGRHGDGEVFRACRKCGKEIDLRNPMNSWQPLFKERSETCRGYWMSQLLSLRKPLALILDDFETHAGQGGAPEARMRNLVLGQAFADLDDVLVAEFLLSLCDANEPDLPKFRGPSFLGADVGVRTIHYSIGHWPYEEKRQMHSIGECGSFDELYDLGQKHNVHFGLIDAGAETRAVWEFVRRTDWAWGARYTSDQAKQYAWSPNERLARLNRTMVLDASHRLLLDRKVSLPRRSTYLEQVFAPQMCNLARVRHTNATTGNQRMQWEITGQKNDHHRHAFALAIVASDRVGLVKSTPNSDYRRREDGGGWSNSWEAA
jgi:hypothetical protein